MKDNRDLRPHSPIANIFRHDFWGTDMEKEHSHKSYRPLTVLTFRFNYWLHQLHPMGYHAFNVLLHAIVCILYHKLVTCLLISSKITFFQRDHQFLLWPFYSIDSPGVQEFSPIPLIATLLFAIHPIHTEAVTGIVGRAELLSSIFFILTILVYQKSSLPLIGLKEINRYGQSGRWRPIAMFALVPIFVGCAMLCKEQVRALLWYHIHV